MNRRTKRVLAGTAAAAVVVAATLGALFAFTPNAKRPQFVEGRPLLGEAGKVFTDVQVGVQFSPPADWAMQARSTESPTNHRPERMLVKYKRLVPGAQVAWLRVTVADADADDDQTPADLLRNRKPQESGWKVIKQVEDGLTVGGLRAARITFGGPFDPTGRGKKDFVSEMVAVRRGAQVFYFAGTFAADDPSGRQQVRAAVESAVFDADRFTSGP